MDTTKGSASLVRRQLGRRLRMYREEAGKNQDDVVEANVAGRTKIWQIETGKIAVRPGDVLALARLYGVPAAETDELLALADASRSTGYTAEFGSGVPDSFGFFADLEAGAAALITYNSELVTGLLQTERYARATVRAGRSLTASAVEERVAFRMKRQRAFFERAKPRRLDVVLSAGALRVRVGSPAVMEEQIAHLRAIGDRDGVSVRVLPFENGLHAAMNGPFTILDFDDPDDPSVVRLESVVGTRYIERPKHVGEFRAAFEDVRAQAIPVREYRE
ncbi:helix-turn-helix domain-containing protein [Pseudonocardia lacus]|uniref:helix-turn-helix domain-containing protein n=1 Tax=Pseudonocardia lacus TaxID=2835865 RepID=UPI001BDC9F99|nr:helix-turn-helix transcriptional regulator [Pseudonocardia lacus]